MTEPHPTQTQQPWAAVRRTAVAVVGFIATFSPLLPEIIKAYGVTATTGWLAGATTVALGITRVIAVPQVNAWLREHLRGAFAADPPSRGGKLPPVGPVE